MNNKDKNILTQAKKKKTKKKYEIILLNDASV